MKGMTTTGSLREPSRRHERLDEEWFHLFALDSIVAELRTESSYRSRGRAGVTLLKTKQLRVVLEAARQEARIEEHTIEGPAFVQVLEGSLRLASGDETRIAHAGEMVSIPHDQPREMRAEQDSAFLWALSLEPSST